MAARRAKRVLPVIGWREWLALPDLGIPSIKAKVDTGARTSSIHAFDVWTYDGADGPRVRFRVHPRQRDSKKTVVIDVGALERRVVRTSAGDAHPRIVIVAEASLMGKRFPIELTLARRDTMGFRLLLGRQALRGRFVVDPGRSFVAGRPKRKPRPA